MATSPTVLVDSSASLQPVAIPATPAAGKIPLVPLVIAVIVGVVIATIGVGGVMYYLVRSGRLPIAAAGAKKKEAAVPTVTHALVLEPVLVNLASAGGTSYLRLALTLRVTDADEKKDAKANSEKEGGKGSDDQAAVRDTVLTVLGQQTAEDLLAADGKDHLKVALRAAFAEHNPDLKVTDVFFTDFLVQR